MVKVSVKPVTKPQTSKLVPLFVVNVTHPVLLSYVPPVTFISLSENNAAEFVTVNVPPVLFVNVSCEVPALALPLTTYVSALTELTKEVKSTLKVVTASLPLKLIFFVPVLYVPPLT